MEGQQKNACSDEHAEEEVTCLAHIGKLKMFKLSSKLEQAAQLSLLIMSPSDTAASCRHVKKNAQ